MTGQENIIKAMPVYIYILFIIFIHCIFNCLFFCWECKFSLFIV